MDSAIYIYIAIYIPYRPCVESCVESCVEPIHSVEVKAASKQPSGHGAGLGLDAWIACACSMHREFLGDDRTRCELLWDRSRFDQRDPVLTEQDPVLTGRDPALTGWDPVLTSGIPF